jgi:HlyD family secretion protein
MSGSRAERSIKRYLIAGVTTCVLLLGGGASLATLITLSGAVIAPGTIVVDSSEKKIQHRTGGVVGEILVREGDAVKAGDILVRLDATLARANLAIVTKGMDQLEARLARLEAERDGNPTIAFPDSLISKANDLTVARTIAGEKSLFDLRREARAGQKAQLAERTAQLGQEAAGLTEQRDAKQREIALIHSELAGIRKLWQQKYVSLERMTALERDATRVEGERGQLTAMIAQAKGRSAEIALQIIQIDQDLRSEVAAELRDVQGRIHEFVERKVAAEEELRRIDLRSPQDGVVHQLAVHTVGGIVGAGEQLMLIVPVNDKLFVEAHIARNDIDQVTPGQPAILRLSAFNKQTTPELTGILVKVSPDLSVDERTGTAFYTARIALPAVEVARLDRLVLAPGMPVEVFLPSTRRTILSYLIKPVSDQIERSFRES